MRSETRILLICSLAICAMSFMTAVTLAVAADSRPHVGFVHPHYDQETLAQEREVGQFLVRNSIRYIHTGISWTRTETAIEHYDFSRYVRIFDRFRRQNIKLYLTLDAGGDGSILEMPPFHAPNAWGVGRGYPDEIDGVSVDGVGLTNEDWNRLANNITWDRSDNTAEVRFTGRNWDSGQTLPQSEVVMFTWSWTATHLGLQPGQLLELDVPVTAIKCQNLTSVSETIFMQYVVVTAGQEWLVRFPPDEQSVSCDGNEHELPFSFRPNAATINNELGNLGHRDFSPDRNFIILILGVRGNPRGSGEESVLKIALAGIDGEIDGSPIDNTVLRWANQDDIRWVYDQASENNDPLTPETNVPELEPQGNNRYKAVFSDKDFQDREEKWMRAVIQWIETNYPDLVVAYGPGNEPWGGVERAGTLIDFSEANTVAFREWLSTERYQGGIHELQNAWGAGYENFSAVQIPRLPIDAGMLQAGASWDSLNPNLTKAPTAWLDFHTFMRDQYIFAYLESRLKIIKEEAPGKETFVKAFPLVPSNATQLINDAVPRLARSQFLDILGVDPYSIQYGMLDREDNAAVRSTFSSVATIAQRYGKRWGIFELGVDIPESTGIVVADLMRYAAAYGPAVIFPFHLVDLPVTPQGAVLDGYYRLEQDRGFWDPNVLGPSGPVMPEFRAVSAAIGALNGAETTTPAAQVAVLYGAAYGGFRANMEGLREVQQALSNLGVRTTVLYDYEVLEGSAYLEQFDAIVIPRLMIARRFRSDTDLLAEINNYITRGGNVILVGPYDRVTYDLEQVNLQQDTFETTNVALEALPVDAVGVNIGGQSNVFIDCAAVAGAGLRNVCPPQQNTVEVDTVTSRDQFHFYVDPGATILANYANNDAAIILSSDGRVLVIGPELEFLSAGANPAGRLLEEILRHWNLLPLELEHRGENIQLVDPQPTTWRNRVFRGSIAHLGWDGLAVGNVSDNAGEQFEITLPFLTELRDQQRNVSATDSGLRTLISGTLGRRQTIFVRLNIDADRKFVEANYQHYLGRPSDLTGFGAHLNSQLSGAPRSALLTTFVDSAEYASRVTDEDFVQLLETGIVGQPATGNELAFLIASLQTGYRRSVLLDDYLNLAFQGTHKHYVTRLYWHILGRIPDSAGLAAHLQALDAGKTRSELRKEFFDSVEFRRRTIDPLDTITTTAILGWDYHLILGDLSGDGILDFQDFQAFFASFGRCAGQAGFSADADYDRDGCITFVDYQIWIGLFASQQ